MRVYQDMMFRVKAADAVAREAYRRLLLQYCELDTAAMVIILETLDKIEARVRRSWPNPAPHIP